jgi:predicted RNA-binding Zn-ribbon protein involved in translation (DUF1610 family)
MATIRASCPTCGDVELTTKDVSVQVCADTNQGAYSFLCPLCGYAVSKQAEQRIIDLLVSSGVRMSLWTLPAELNEPKSGQAFTWDDVLEFHDLLEKPGWFDALLREVGPVTDDLR